MKPLPMRLDSPYWTNGNVVDGNQKRIKLLEDGIRVLARDLEIERDDRKFVGMLFALSLGLNIWLIILWAVFL